MSQTGGVGQSAIKTGDGRTAGEITSEFEFNDGAAHDIIIFGPFSQETISIVVDVTAHDEVNKRSAWGLVTLAIAQYSDGTVELLPPGPTAALIVFSAGAPWNTISATVLIVGNTVVLRIQGLGNVKIRWEAYWEIRHQIA